MYRTNNKAVVTVYMEELEYDVSTFNKAINEFIQYFIGIEEEKEEAVNSGKLTGQGWSDTTAASYNVKQAPTEVQIDRIKNRIANGIEEKGYKVSKINVTVKTKGAPTRSSGTAPTYIQIEAKTK